MGEESTANVGAQSTWLHKIRDWLLWFIKDQWFLVCTCVNVLIASQVQVPKQGQAIKQTIISYLSVSIIFFITGCTLDTRVLINNYAKWRQHTFIQVGCFLVVSALAFAVVSLTATNKTFMEPWLLVGLILNGCQPTAMASNVMFTRQAHGNAPLAVVQTTMGNFLGPFLSPILFKMYLSTGAWYTKVVPIQSGGYSSLYRRLFMQFGLSIYLPMAVGQVIRHFFPNAVKKVFVDWKVAKIGSLALMTLLWQSFDHAFQEGAFQTAKTSNMIFIVFVAVINYIIWLVISIALAIPLFDRKDIVTVAMCVPAKTLALGIPMSLVLFTGLTPLQEAQLQIPMAIFQMIQMSMASLITIGLRKWVDAGEKKKAAGMTDSLIEHQGGLQEPEPIALATIDYQNRETVNETVSKASK